MSNTGALLAMLAVGALLLCLLWGLLWARQKSVMETICQGKSEEIWLAELRNDSESQSAFNKLVHSLKNGEEREAGAALSILGHAANELSPQNSETLTKEVERVVNTSFIIRGTERTALIDAWLQPRAVRLLVRLKGPAAVSDLIQVLEHSGHSQSIDAAIKELERMGRSAVAAEQALNDIASNRTGRRFPSAVLKRQQQLARNAIKTIRGG